MIDQSRHSLLIILRGWGEELKLIGISVRIVRDIVARYIKWLYLSVLMDPSMCGLLLPPLPFFILLFFV